MKPRIRTNGIVIFATVMLIAFFPAKFLRPNTGEYDLLFSCWGMALVMLGLLLRVSARGYKAQNSGQGQALVRGGPYRFVRNPMYLGILLIGFGVIAISFQWWVVVLFVLVLARLYYTLILKEETLLEQLFGSEYSEYKTQAPRLLPSLSGWLTRNAAECLPLRWPWLKRELPSLITLPLAIVAIEVWRTVAFGHRAIPVAEFFGFTAVFAVFAVFASGLQRDYGRNAS